MAHETPPTSDSAEQGQPARKSRVLTRGKPFSKDNPGRPFTPGNPGRPAGSRNKATHLAQALLDGEAELLMRTAVEQAVAGNVGALRLCLDRLVPLRRERTVAVALPAVETASDAVKAAGQVAALVGAGELTPTEGQALASVIEAQRRAIETEELERRVSALEGRAP